MYARNFGIWSAVLGVSLFGTRLCGTLIAPQSPLWLEQKADLVVVGTSGEAVMHSNTLSFTLRVDRVIKGDSTKTGTSIPAVWMSSGAAGASGSLNVSGLWFLQQTASAWNILPVVQGTLDFSQTYFPTPAGPVLSAYTYSQSASAQDKLASEISSGIEASTGYVFQYYAVFEAGLLDDLRSPVLTRLYQRLAASANNRLLGLSGLIRNGDATALAEAARTAAADQGNQAEGALLLSIRAYFRSADPSAVAVLGATATDSSNSNTAFREAAAHALAAIHTAASLPFLATLLDDPDPNLRVEAVGGIGAFANGLAVQTAAGMPSLAHLQLPAKAPYKTADTVAHLAFGRAIAANEAFYVLFWKSWWEQNRASIGY